MKFITEPSVRLVGEPFFNDDQMVPMLEAMGVDIPEELKGLDPIKDCEILAENPKLPRDGLELAGRTCYMSFCKGRPYDEYIKHIIESGHGSVLEHVNFTFQIWGISRSLSHELVRHRAGMAYSQLSQRYVDSSDVNFIVPQAIQELKEENEKDSWCMAQFYSTCEVALKAYKNLADYLYDEIYVDVEDKTERRKKARQAARSVLPNATETIMTVTMNARAFRHFCEQRGSEHAEVEIRVLACKVFDIINERWPLICHGMEKVDGCINSKFRKV